MRDLDSLQALRALSALRLRGQGVGTRRTVLLDEPCQENFRFRGKRDEFHGHADLRLYPTHDRFDVDRPWQSLFAQAQIDHAANREGPVVLLSPLVTTL